MLAIVQDLSENRTLRRIQRTKYRFALYCEFTSGDPNIKIEHVFPYFLGQHIYVVLCQCIIPASSDEENVIISLSTPLRWIYPIIVMRCTRRRYTRED